MFAGGFPAHVDPAVHPHAERHTELPGAIFGQLLVFGLPQRPDRVALLAWVYERACAWCARWSSMKVEMKKKPWS
jgi:hypothetical protein